MGNEGTSLSHARGSRETQRRLPERLRPFPETRRGFIERRLALMEIQRRFPESGWRFIVRHRRVIETPGGFIETDAASPETPWRFIETRRAEITYLRDVSRNRAGVTHKPLPHFQKPLEVNRFTAEG